MKLRFLTFTFRQWARFCVLTRLAHAGAMAVHNYLWAQCTLENTRTCNTRQVARTRFN